MAENSWNSERVKTYKARKAAMDTLMAASAEGLFLDCIIAFQNYPFHLISGRLFSYMLKIGKNGENTKELFIDR